MTTADYVIIIILLTANLLAEASFKKFNVRFQFWPTVLLEREGNLADQLLRSNFVEGNFSTYVTFSNCFFAGGSGNILY